MNNQPRACSKSFLVVRILLLLSCVFYGVSCSNPSIQFP